MINNYSDMTLTDKQYSDFKHNVRLCALTYQLCQAFSEQASAIYGDDKYADLTVVVTACCLADQFENVIGKKAPSKVMPISDISSYVDETSDAQFDVFKNDKKLTTMTDDLTSLLVNNYENHLYGDYPMHDAQLMLLACNVAHHFRKITKPNMKKKSYDYLK